MRKVIAPVLLCLLAAGACTNENDWPAEDAMTVLTVEVPGQTKTVLGDPEEGFRPVLWCKGDKISVNGVASEALDIEGDAVSADFTFNAEVSAPYSIIYPSDMAKDATTVTLPSSQKAVKGDNIVSGSLPMAGFSTTENVRMGQLCGILGVQLKAGSDTDMIRYIEVSSTGGEQLSGDFNVDFQECALTPAGNAESKIRMEVQDELSGDAVRVFNVILPAGTYSEGFAVKVVDENGHAMKRSIGGERELVAGKLMLMPELIFEPNGEEKGIEITTPEEWNSFATAYNAGEYPDSQIANIVNDLDFTSIGADEFVTLGLRDGAKQFPEDGKAKYFAGTLNGNGKKIMNLNTDVPFIQAIGTDALVKDLNIDESCSFTPWYGGDKQLEFGSLIGYCSEGKVLNCASAAKVTVSQCNSVANKFPFYVGGLIGRNRAAAISGCTNSGEIVADATYVTNAVDSTDLYVGGLVGYCSNNDGLIENSSNDGNISIASSAFNIYVGGICAKGSAGTISKCTNSGAITASTARFKGKDLCKFLYLGGLFGTVDAGSKALLRVVECSNSGDIVSASNVKQLIAGGIAAQLGTANAEFTGTVSSGNIKTTAALRNLYCGGLFGRVTKAQTLNFSGEPYTGSISIGATDGLDENKNPTSYLYCGGIIGQTTKNVVISGDITWNSSIVYDISAANSYGVETFFGGILGCAYGAPINISGVSAAGSVKIATPAKKAMQHKLCGVGGIIGGATKGAVISDCSSKIYVEMTEQGSKTNGNSVHFGGIAGRLYGGNVEIKHCTNSGRQQNNHYNNNIWSNGYSANATGGIVGSIGYLKGNTYTAVIEDCHNSGSVYAYRSAAGGIAGYISNGTISDCSSTGDITRSAPGGGIAGVVENCKISSCDVKSGVRGTDGGSCIGNAGGIIGESVASSVYDCKYFGALTSDATIFGGIIGKADDASSAGVTTACGFGGTINGTAVTKDNVNDCAIGSTAGKRGTFYLWDGTL